MYETYFDEHYQLKQAKIEPLEQENTVFLRVLPVKRDTPAARVRVKTTAEWDALATRVLKRGVLIAYSDYTSRLDDEGREIVVPGMKVGDGVTPIGSLPFIMSSAAAEILTLSEDEMRQILGDVPPEQDGPDAPPAPKPPEVMSEDEMLEILNKGSDPLPDATAGSGNILTEDELLQILNHNDQEKS